MIEADQVGHTVRGANHISLATARREGAAMSQVCCASEERSPICLLFAVGLHAHVAHPFHGDRRVEDALELL